MQHTSPFLAMQEVERQIKGVLRIVDTDMLSAEEKKAVASIKRLAVDARIDIRDYELSETRAEQLKLAVAGKRRLARLEAALHAAGPVFGAADIAHFSAQIELISSRLI